MGPGLAFVWPYCRVPLFTQSLTLYAFLSLNCIGLCCPLVNQYHLSNDISNSIQRGLSRWWLFPGRAGWNEPCKYISASCAPTMAYLHVNMSVCTSGFLSLSICLSRTLCAFVDSQSTHSWGHVVFEKRACLPQLHAQHSAARRWARCMISLDDVTISAIKTILPTLDSSGEQERERELTCLYQSWVCVTKHINHKRSNPLLCPIQRWSSSAAPWQCLDRAGHNYLFVYFNKETSECSDDRGTHATKLPYSDIIPFILCN